MNLSDEIQQYYSLKGTDDQSIDKLINIIANLVVFNRLIQQERGFKELNTDGVVADSLLDSVDYLTKSKEYYESAIKLHPSFRFHLSLKLILEKVSKILQDENALQKSKAFLYANELNRHKFSVLSFTSFKQSRKEIIENDINVLSKQHYQIELQHDDQKYVAEITNLDTAKIYHIINLSCKYEDVFEICFENRELQIIFYVDMEDRKNVYRVEVMSHESIPVISFQ